jgi:hypothetical protein
MIRQERNPFSQGLAKFHWLALGLVSLRSYPLINLTLPMIPATAPCQSLALSALDYTATGDKCNEHGSIPSRSTGQISHHVSFVMEEQLTLLL